MNKNKFIAEQNIQIINLIDRLRIQSFNSNHSLNWNWSQYFEYQDQVRNHCSFSIIHRSFENSFAFASALCNDYNSDIYFQQLHRLSEYTSMAPSVAPAGGSSSNQANQNGIGSAGMGSLNSTAVSAALSQVPSFNDGSVVARSWNHTQVKVVKFSYSWTIHNYSFCTEEKDQSFDSPTFSAGFNNELKWCLRLYPRGDVLDSSGNHLSVYLVLISSGKSEVPTKINKLSILSAEGEESYSKVSEKVDKFVENKSWGYPKFIKLAILLNKENGLLPDDKLTILCESTAALERINILELSCGLQFEVPEYKLFEDLSSLFENQEFSDITLSVSGKDLRVHKAILAARSSVFAAMFKHKMLESEQSKVVITDMTYELLKEMLSYIYSGKSPNLEKMAKDLLAAGDKYDLSGLKVMCETVLCFSMTVENAADLLVLADMHCAKRLKTQAIHFINAQAMNVIKTPAWKNMTSNYPQVIVEVFEALWPPSKNPTSRVK